MSSDTSRARLRRFAGYTAFTIFSLFLFLWLTFPYEVVERTVLQQAQAAGLDLRIGSTGPGLFGVRFSKLQLLPKPEAGQDADGTKALVIDSLSVRPSLFPMGVHLSADALGGDVSGSYGLLGDPKLRVSLDELSTQQGNFKAFTGIDMTALISGRLDLDIPKTQGPGGKQPDLSGANGLLALTLDGVQINGGTLTGSMPLDLPKADLGDLKLEIPFEKGVGTVKTFDGNGQDLQLGGDGTIHLARRMDSSRLDLQIRLKASEAFKKDQPIVGMGLSALPPDRQNPDFRMARIAGTLTKPTFVPGR